jgi:hypothetical protein
MPRTARTSADLSDDASGDQAGAISHRHAQGGSRQSAAGGLGRAPAVQRTLTLRTVRERHVAGARPGRAANSVIVHAVLGSTPRR